MKARGLKKKKKVGGGNLEKTETTQGADKKIKITGVLLLQLIYSEK